MRIAVFDTELSRRGPGLMLRDILKDDPQAIAVAQIIAHHEPDAVFLMGIDYDADLHGLRALRNLVAEHGHDMPHIFARAPNSGMATGLDMDGDGRRGTPRDAQSYGRFAGADGNALMSRLPIQTDQIHDFTALLWQNLPGARLPRQNGAPFPSPKALAIQRLSSTSHWIVPIATEKGQRLDLLLWSAGPPVFDGPEDRNGLRNADENALWLKVLNEQFGPELSHPFLLTGGANLDPERGEGIRDTIQDLLAHQRLQDPFPTSPAHGPLTVDWTDPKPGDMRVDYVLPSADLTILDQGVFWPTQGDPGAALLSHDGTPASRHRLVWVDITLP